MFAPVLVLNVAFAVAPSKYALFSDMRYNVVVTHRRRRSTFREMPKETLGRIASCLDLRSLCNVELVNRFSHSAAREVGGHKFEVKLFFKDPDHRGDGCVPRGVIKFGKTFIKECYFPSRAFDGGFATEICGQVHHFNADTDLVHNMARKNRHIGLVHVNNTLDTRFSTGRLLYIAGPLYTELIRLMRHAHSISIGKVCVPPPPPIDETFRNLERLCFHGLRGYGFGDVLANSRWLKVVCITDQAPATYLLDLLHRRANTIDELHWAVHPELLPLDWQGEINLCAKRFYIRIDQDMMRAGEPNSLEYKGHMSNLFVLLEGVPLLALWIDISFEWPDRDFKALERLLRLSTSLPRRWRRRRSGPSVSRPAEECRKSDGG